MTQLGTALRELAESGKRVAAADPGDLWTRGRRRVRRRRMVGAAVAAALVAAAGIGAVLMPAPVVVMPAGEPHAPALPSNIYTPTRHLAGTAKQGPLGRIAVIGGTGTGARVFGISATTGEYRLLDLPAGVPGTAVQLSPDGNRVAYWYGAHGRQDASADAANPADGVAIYDARTGVVQKAGFGTSDGITPRSLTWLGDSTLYFSYSGRAGDRSTGHEVGMLLPVGGSPRMSNQVDTSNAQVNRDGSLSVPVGSHSSDRYLLTKDGRLVASGTRVVLPVRPTPDSAVNPYRAPSLSGDRVLVVPGSLRSYGDPLAVGELTVMSSSPNQMPVTVRSVLSLTQIGELQQVRLLGWRDDHTALVTAMLGADTSQVVQVDVDSRKTHVLGVAPLSNFAPGLQFARDLLPRPLVHGQRPPDPQLPIAWIALGGLGLAAGALWLFRRWRRA